MGVIDKQANFQDYYEYHGNTTIERERKRGEITIWRDWIIFDSVEEAEQYFNDNCQQEGEICLNVLLM